MENIQEELKSVGGTSGTIVDPDTNEPIANYAKSYGKNYSLSWHPVFLALHPDVKSSIVAQDLTAGRSPDNKDSARYRVDHIHSHLASNGFKDRVRVTRNTDGDVHNYRHPETDDIVMSSSPGKESWDPRIFTLHPDFVASHNIPDPVKSSYEQSLAKSSSHKERESAIMKMISDVSKKKVGTGIDIRTASHATYHTSEPTDVASSAHEEHLKSLHPKLDVSRLSPSHFIAKGKDRTIHSIVDGNNIHEITTRNETTPTRNTSSF